MPGFIHSIGRETIERFKAYTRMVGMLVRAVNAGFSLSFLNRAVFTVTVRQVYFTAVQAMPIVPITALALGSIPVHFLLNLLTNLGAYDEIGGYLTWLMLDEIAPFTCALIITLRSVPAVISEMALMSINKEFDTLRMLGVKEHHYIYLPRIVAFIFAGPSMALIFSVIGLIGSFFVLGYVHDITFNSYLDHILYGIRFSNLVVLLTKPAIMSAGICLISIGRGIQAEKTITEVPVLLIKGMTECFAFLGFVEVVFILLS